VKQTRDRGLWGLPTGIGQGLLGIVTKPIGGALELVNLTSQGLLLQSGMMAIVKHRRYLFSLFFFIPRANAVFFI
jgi:hypothetical protein